MLSVFVARNTHEMEKLRERWEQCASESGTIFQRFLWANLAAAMFAAVESPLMVVAESDSGLALIPAAVICGGTALGMIGERLFDYRDVLHVGDESVLRRAWARLSSLGLPMNFKALRGDGREANWKDFELSPFAN